MTIWIVAQAIVNLILVAGMVFLLISRKHTQKEDQKFSKGLQLLQNKISVLEDLSDQTDEQVRTLTQLLEGKYREIQGLLVESDQQIQKMEEIARNIWSQVQSADSMKTSTDTQNMNKYVKAAQMAHAGRKIDEIIREIDITRGEAELIVAMNKDQLTFNQNTLPLWVQPEAAAAPQPTSIGMEFIKALKQTPAPQMNANQTGIASQNQNIQNSRQTVASGSQTVASSGTNQALNNKNEPKIRPFEFKRIDLG